LEDISSKKLKRSERKTKLSVAVFLEKKRKIIDIYKEFVCDNLTGLIISVFMF